ncbi:hypothetical protein EYF80_040950 [Liparis tanakae]|uniref:Uncharacterized protein n=1 Tax=Liparis tanakae TaxID=230148 RepID=A0A4Z2G7V6_9TELE|nr:hypothetical protein EYF80_040950 [Liparis tanakae]
MKRSVREAQGFSAPKGANRLCGGGGLSRGPEEEEEEKESAQGSAQKERLGLGELEALGKRGGTGGLGAGLETEPPLEQRGGTGGAIKRLKRALSPVFSLEGVAQRSSAFPMRDSSSPACRVKL